jgi:hypothetical protein
MIWDIIYGTEVLLLKDGSSFAVSGDMERENENTKLLRTKGTLCLKLQIGI